jgi:hypothetical protein
MKFNDEMKFNIDEVSGISEGKTQRKERALKKSSENVLATLPPGRYSKEEISSIINEALSSIQKPGKYKPSHVSIFEEDLGELLKVLHDSGKTIVVEVGDG